MKNKRLDQICCAEAFSHTEAYTRLKLFDARSWLSKPVKTVMELTPHFSDYQTFTGLDLGCGIGRNCIPILLQLNHIPCTMDCVDILGIAIEKLRENAIKYQVESSINGIVCPVDSYQIKENNYDLILGVSVLEHLDSIQSLKRKLLQIREGLRINGIACFVVNTSIKERSKSTKEALPVQFKINMDTDSLMCLLHEVFVDQDILKQRVIHYTYETFRERGTTELDTNVLTYVVRKRS